MAKKTYSSTHLPNKKLMTKIVTPIKPGWGRRRTKIKTYVSCVAKIRWLMLDKAYLSLNTLLGEIVLKLKKFYPVKAKVQELSHNSN